MSLSELKWDDAGLVTVVVQDQFTGEIRMLAHANLEALQATLSTGLAHFYSRSRRALWCKGETSGNTIAVHTVYADCDGDALVYSADPHGPSCHTGEPSCFFRPVTAAGEVADAAAQPGVLPTLPALFRTLEERSRGAGAKSYTRSLLDKGCAKIGEKVTEEAQEYVQALLQESNERVLSEAADLTYHMLVGLLARGVTLRQLEQQLATRFGLSGLEEKANRNR